MALASEPSDLTGVDVMETFVSRAKNDEDKKQFLQNMKHCFTSNEWKTIYGSPDIDKQVVQFFRHWTLKEGFVSSFPLTLAYIKAVGIGLGFELQRADFTLDNNESPSSATIKIDGQQRGEWTFDIEALDSNHVVSCSRGPPSQAVPSYRETLSPSVSSRDPNDQVVHFQIFQVADLLPK